MHQHLSDDKIQDFLDGNFGPQEEALREHLDDCAICQSNLRAYGRLVAELQKDPGFELSKGFVKSVVSKLAVEKAVPFSFPLAEVVFIGLGLLLALGATFYFVDLGTLTRSLGRVTLPVLSLDPVFLQHVKNVLADFNGSLGYLPFAGLALLLVALLDRIVLRSRHHRLSL